MYAARNLDGSEQRHGIRQQRFAFEYFNAFIYTLDSLSLGHVPFHQTLDVNSVAETVDEVLKFVECYTIESRVFVNDGPMDQPRYRQFQFSEIRNTSLLGRIDGKNRYDLRRKNSFLQLPIIFSRLA